MNDIVSRAISMLQSLDKDKLKQGVKSAGKEVKRLLINNPYDFGTKVGTDIRGIVDIARAGNVRPQIQPDKMREVLTQLKRVGGTGTFLAGLKAPVAIPTASAIGVAGDVALGQRNPSQLAANAIKHSPQAVQMAGLSVLASPLVSSKMARLAKAKIYERMGWNLRGPQGQYLDFERFVNDVRPYQR